MTALPAHSRLVLMQAVCWRADAATALHTTTTQAPAMTPTTDPLAQYSDDALMQRYFDLSGQPEQHAEELAAIDAAIQQRLVARYGRAEGTSPRIRVAAST